jgi:hypothetical protein
VARPCLGSDEVGGVILTIGPPTLRGIEGAPPPTILPRPRGDRCRRRPDEDASTRPPTRAPRG